MYLDYKIFGTEFLTNQSNSNAPKKYKILEFLPRYSGIPLGQLSYVVPLSITYLTPTSDIISQICNTVYTIHRL